MGDYGRSVSMRMIFICYTQITTRWGRKVAYLFSYLCIVLLVVLRGRGRDREYTHVTSVVGGSAQAVQSSSLTLPSLLLSLSSVFLVVPYFPGNVTDVADPVDSERVRRRRAIKELMRGGGTGMVGS